MSTRFVNKTLCAAVAAVLYSSASSAQQAPAEPTSTTELDTVVVTGSLIKGTPEDAALPVEVYTAEDLREAGDPTPLEFVKDLSISGPTTGEAYYFGGSGNTNNVQFNLRGIGADKTLTLFNGRRAFQNVSVYPASVIDRTEILKDGAAVTYGADATGGVVMLRTRDKFQGFETAASYKTYDGSEDGEWKLSAVAGVNTDYANVLFAVEWDHRSELGTQERDFSTLPYGVNPAPSSPLTNLAAWVPRQALPAPAAFPAQPFPNTANGEWGTPSIPGALNFVPDFTQSSCEAVGGIFATTNGASCIYNYIPYYNIVEENDVYRVYAQVTTKITDSTNFHLRALWARNYAPHQYGSPSQPVIRGPARATGATHQIYVPSTNPYVAAFAARTGFASNANFATTAGYTPITYRAFAHGGNDTFASGDNHSTPNENETKYWHITTGFDGDITDRVSFDTAATFNQSVSKNTAPDIMGFRLQQALNGFGGPNCNAPDLDPNRFGTQNPALAGVGNCMWYNPFASNFARQPTLNLANPSYVVGAENPASLISWMTNERYSEQSNYNFTFDGVLSGALPLALPGGEIGWAGGVQWRTTKNRESVPDPLYNGMTPCDWPGQDPAASTDTARFSGCTLDLAGPFLFFANNPPDSTQQRQQSIFAEVNLPILDSLNFNGAVRHEKFSGDLDTTVYKLSGKWDVIDFDSATISLRGSYGTNYQAPGANVIPGDINNGVNSYTRAGGTWLGAVTVTRTDIEPETATVWGAGIIGQFSFGSDQDLQIILDYFDIQTEKELGLLATANDIADSVFAAPVAVGAPALANCTHPLVDRVTFNSPCVQGTTNAATGFSSIRTDFGNGPGQHTAGFDLQLNYTIGIGPGKLRLAATTTKVETFELGPTILDGFQLKGTDNRLGTLNFATIAQAAPEWRGNFSVNYSLSEHNFRGVVNYISGVKDERYFKPSDGTIDLALITPAGRPTGGPATGPGSTFAPSYYGVRVGKWVTGDLHYLWRAEWATVGFSVLNVTDEDPPESRQEFGYDPRIGNPLGRQFEVSLRKEFK